MQQVHLKNLGRDIDRKATETKRKKQGQVAPVFLYQLPNCFKYGRCGIWHIVKLFIKRI